MSTLNLEEKPNTPGGSPDDMNREELEGRMRNGASWFYWIAGLSVINMIIYIGGSDVAFLAGLGLTQLAQALVDVSIESGAPSALRFVAIAINLVLIAVFAFFGYYAGKGSSAAFIIGIGLYVLDGLLLLLLGVFLSAGFHAFALIFIIRGFLACRSLNAFAMARPFQAPPPPPAPSV